MLWFNSSCKTSDVIRFYDNSKNLCADQVLSFDVDLLLKDKAIMRKLCNTEDFKDAKACRNLANEQVGSCKS